ncbi:MAG: hypothetical protein HFE78_02665 [Clostridiales bacterium]|nr:hypothetical protein [Clostridiales bacterium]
MKTKKLVLCLCVLLALVLIAGLSALVVLSARGSREDGTDRPDVDVVEGSYTARPLLLSTGEVYYIHGDKCLGEFKDESAEKTKEISLDGTTVSLTYSTSRIQNSGKTEHKYLDEQENLYAFNEQGDLSQFVLANENNPNLLLSPQFDCVTIDEQTAVKVAQRAAGMLFGDRLDLNLDDEIDISALDNSYIITGYERLGEGGWLKGKCCRAVVSSNGMLLECDMSSYDDLSDAPSSLLFDGISVQALKEAMKARERALYSEIEYGKIIGYEFDREYILENMHGTYYIRTGCCTLTEDPDGEVMRIGYHHYYYDIVSADETGKAADGYQEEKDKKGICTIKISKYDGRQMEYEFAGDDAAALTELLSGLKYDGPVCYCEAEFTVVSESGEAYGVNIREKYARHNVHDNYGQTDLTEKDIEMITEIFERRCKGENILDIQGFSL